MARPLRIEFPGALYHVTARGNARADIFLDDADFETVLSGSNCCYIAARAAADNEKVVFHPERPQFIRGLAPNRLQEPAVCGMLVDSGLGSEEN